MFSIGSDKLDSYNRIMKSLPIDKFSFDGLFNIFPIFPHITRGRVINAFLRGNNLFACPSLCDENSIQVVCFTHEPNRGIVNRLEKLNNDYSGKMPITCEYLDSEGNSIRKVIVNHLLFLEEALLYSKENW